MTAPIWTARIWDRYHVRDKRIPEWLVVSNKRYMEIGSKWYGL